MSATAHTYFDVTATQLNQFNPHKKPLHLFLICIEKISKMQVKHVFIYFWIVVQYCSCIIHLIYSFVFSFKKTHDEFIVSYTKHIFLQNLPFCITHLHSSTWAYLISSLSNELSTQAFTEGKITLIILMVTLKQRNWKLSFLGWILHDERWAMRYRVLLKTKTKQKHPLFFFLKCPCSLNDASCSVNTARFWGRTVRIGALSSLGLNKIHSLLIFQP